VHGERITHHQIVVVLGETAKIADIPPHGISPHLIGILHMAIHHPIGLVNPGNAVGGEINLEGP